jgi:organic radical activating enzyme
MIIMSKHELASLGGTDYDGDGYNWGNFTLADPKSKLDYLATAIWQQLSSQGDELSALVVTRELLSLPEWSPSGTIDHQSTFHMPGSEDGATIDANFARAFARWIQSESVVVLGGNDNDDPHPNANGQDLMPFEREGSNPYVAKYDELSGSWTLFNKSNGAKMRMAFDPSEELELQEIKPKVAMGIAPALRLGPAEKGEPPRMGSPELVDVKITDYCDIGCAYCYQGSTVEGKHAKLEDIQELARQFFKAGILEVALGGGEPTRHPEFVNILEAFSSQGIVANFTTRDLSFLSDPQLSERILGASKSIAVSVSSKREMDSAWEMWNQSGWAKRIYSNPFSYQYVMGTSSDEELRAMIQKSTSSNFNLTLLGYKDSGRGAQWRLGKGKTMMVREAKVQNQSGAWIGTVKESMGERSWSKVCIDTALARECEPQLEEGKIPRHLWHKSEGLVSMYVDAVDMTMGVSSYEDKGSMTPFGKEWLSTFGSWTPSADQSARKKGPSHV